MKTLIITLTLAIICGLLFGIRVLFVKGGKFPSMHAHDIEKRKQQINEKIKSLKSPVSSKIEQEKLEK